MDHLPNAHRMCRLREFQSTFYVGEFNRIGMVSGVIVFAEIGGCMEDDVSAFEIGRELGYVLNVSDEDASCRTSKSLLRLFFGPGQHPHLMTVLMKNTDQIVS
ncbi:MAG: hypothetical protein JWQ49_1487 [Edaphobacter sp.]|nr:hypothetical protein [Edaphobacter sp.]